MSAATLFGRSLYRSPFYGFYPVGGISPTYPTVHAIYFVTTAITLSWAKVDLATAYQIQVSSTPDFSGTLMINVPGITLHNYSFTDTGTNDTKRWWRWRASMDGGTSYGQWSEVGSYWINTSGAENVNLSINQWAAINPSPVTDRYILPDFPMYAISQNHLYRVRERNRVGTLLSEYVTMKGAIQLMWRNDLFLTKTAFFELRRFNEEVKTFFLGTFKSTCSQIPTPNIWKVQYDSDPMLTMFAAGRQDLFAGTLNLMEV